MAYILRSIAVIGVIALNSPVLGERTAGGETPAAAREAAKAPGPIDAKAALGTAMHGVTAAREAAQILAGLDPATRERLMGLAAAGAKAQAESIRNSALR